MRPETKERYPANWTEISRLTIKARGGSCEDCGAKQYREGRILTVHHIDYDPSNNENANLLVLCQGCHLRRQAWDLAVATRLKKAVLLIRMGQLYFEGMAPEIPKRLDLVMQGKVLSRTLGDRFHARPGISRSPAPAGPAGRG